MSSKYLICRFIHGNPYGSLAFAATVVRESRWGLVGPDLEEEIKRLAQAEADRLNEDVGHRVAEFLRARASLDVAIQVEPPACYAADRINNSTWGVFCSPMRPHLPGSAVPSIVYGVLSVDYEERPVAGEDES